MINLLYQVLQIQPYPKWRIIKNFKNYLKVRDLKKQIKKVIYDKNEFFKNIIDFVTFMDKCKNGLSIEVTTNFKCDTIVYSINAEKYNYILQYMIPIDEVDYDIRFCYYTEEPNRANIRMAMHNVKPSYHLTYDWYIDKEKITSYRSIDQIKEKFLLATMNYVDIEISRLIDEIAKKYIYKKKEKVTKVDEETEVPEGETL